MFAYYRRAGSTAELKGCSSTFSGLPPVGGSVVSLVPGIALSHGNESLTTMGTHVSSIFRGYKVITHMFGVLVFKGTR